LTSFILNDKIDCGDIILQRKIDILPNETTGELYNRLKILGAKTAIETLSLIEKFDFSRQSQNCVEENSIKLAPKIHKEDTVIDWNFPAKDIINKIRGLAPYPGAVTVLTKNTGEKITLKIFEAAITSEKSVGALGKIDTDDKTFLHISTKDFKIAIYNLQMEGKKRMDVGSFLQGNKISNYIIKM